jgi:hypothetical protein
MLWDPLCNLKRGARGFRIALDTSEWALHAIIPLHHRLAEILLLCAALPEINPKQQQVW